MPIQTSLKMCLIIDAHRNNQVNWNYTAWILKKRDSDVWDISISTTSDLLESY